MKLNKMKQYTMVMLLISLGIFTTMTMSQSKHRYLMQEYDEEYDYTGGKPSTNTGAIRSEQ